MRVPKKSAKPIDVEPIVREKLNTHYGVVKLDRWAFEPSDIIEGVNPIAWYQICHEHTHELVNKGLAFVYEDAIYWVKDSVEENC
jgi:hypothetical protein